MRVGWYIYSHRGGGFWPMDPRNTSVWADLAEDLELLRGFEPPYDEVNSCFSGPFHVCKTKFRDDGICVAEQHIMHNSNQCTLTLKKVALSEDSPAEWHGAIPQSESLVPITVPHRDRPWQRYPVHGYSRYGGSEQVMSWLELADAAGVGEVGVCELMDANRCIEEVGQDGDTSACHALLVGQDR